MAHCAPLRRGFVFEHARPIPAPSPSGGPHPRPCTESSPFVRTCPRSRGKDSGRKCPSPTRAHLSLRPSVRYSLDVSPRSVDALRRASTLALTSATYGAVWGTSPDWIAGCSRAQTPRNQDRGSNACLDPPCLVKQLAGFDEVPQPGLSARAKGKPRRRWGQRGAFNGRFALEG